MDKKVKSGKESEEIREQGDEKENYRYLRGWDRDRQWQAVQATVRQAQYL